MPFPDRLARFNRRVTNPLFRLFAGRLPPFAVVEHRGRRSGRSYATPIMAFPAGDGYAIALTYGPDRDWVKNVRAAGGCVLVRGGRRVPLARPVVLGDDGAALMPAAIRPVLRRAGVTDFLRLDAVPANAHAPPASLD
jgi:deazaflavin-dependent oxidoreductase (nitroreductase family)